MLPIRPQPSTSRRDFEPHGPEGTRAISSSARSVSNCYSFKHSFKYVPNEWPKSVPRDQSFKNVPND